MGRVAGVIDDPPGFPYAPPVVDILEGGISVHLQRSLEHLQYIRKTDISAVVLKLWKQNQWFKNMNI